MIPQELLLDHRFLHSPSRFLSSYRALLADPAVRRLRRRLEPLRGRYAGKRCFVMGNGPSLNQMDLERFRSDYVWGANRCHLLYDRITWRHAFYVAVDRRVVPDIADEINQLVEAMPGTCFFLPCLTTSE